MRSSETRESSSKSRLHDAKPWCWQAARASIPSVASQATTTLFQQPICLKPGSAPAEEQIRGATLAAAYNMGGSGVANYCSILEPVK